MTPNSKTGIAFIHLKHFFQYIEQNAEFILDWQNILRLIYDTESELFSLRKKLSKNNQK